MFHLGYFYNLPGTYNKGRVLVLGFVESCFKFYATEYNLIPQHYYYNTNNYHNLAYPVLFNLNGDSINEIIFLKDLEIVSNSTKENIDGFSILRLHENDMFCLQHNGNSNLFEVGYSEKEKEFTLLLVNYTASQMLTQKYADSSNYISASDEHIDYRWKKVISTYKNYIDSIDLQNLLSSLYVKVWDHHFLKVGGDDRYYVYRLAYLQDGTNIEDPYLKELIGLGEVCIEKDSGYTSYFERPNIPFGEYEGEVLEDEKKRIISKYSKEEHMGWLFYHKLFEQRKDSEELQKWQGECSKTYTELNKKLSISKIPKIDQRFFYELSNDKLPLFNEYIERTLRNLPDYKIVFSGTVNEKERPQFIKQLSKIIEELSQKYNVLIVTGNSDGAEKYALNFATQHYIDFITNYSEWTMLGRERGMERARKMSEIADMIYLTGDIENYLYKNFISASNECGKEVRYIF